MLNQKSLHDCHKAAQMIESDGHEAYFSVKEKYGEDIANFLLVAFLRQQKGSMTSYPAPEECVNLVNEFLRSKGLVETAAQRERQQELENFLRSK